MHRQPSVSCLRKDFKQVNQDQITGIVLPSLLQVVFFTLKGSVVIWTRWLIKDVGVRQAYHNFVSIAAAEMLRDIYDRMLTAQTRLFACATLYVANAGQNLSQWSFNRMLSQTYWRHSRILLEQEREGGYYIKVVHVSVYSSRSVLEAAETIEMLTDIPVEKGMRKAAFIKHNQVQKSLYLFLPLL